MLWVAKQLYHSGDYEDVSPCILVDLYQIFGEWVIWGSHSYGAEI
jgi:hypothetical protein